MNKIKYYFILTIATLSLFSCSKSDSASIEPLRDYTEQYNTDIADIEDYLDKNYIIVTNKPGETEDQNVKIEKITDAADPAQRSIKSYLNSPTFPTLKSKIVDLHGVKYKLYYMVLREGTGEAPCNVDGVLTSYNGTYLSKKAATTAGEPSVITATQFEEVVFPQTFLNLFQTIKGWGETFPNFKVGTAVGDPKTGAIKYDDFGAGIMFLPSGLAYYAGGGGSIPSYAPLVFSFKLYALQRLDHDGDGILSYLEDKDGDGYVRDMRNIVEYPKFMVGDNPDDTDKDGIPDFLDTDDDGDGYSTKLETKRPDTVIGDKIITNGYYPFNGAAEDDISTPYIDETQGIPAYISATKTFDYTSPNRTRVYLDNTYPLKK